MDKTLNQCKTHQQLLNFCCFQCKSLFCPDCEYRHPSSHKIQPLSEYLLNNFTIIGYIENNSNSILFEVWDYLKKGLFTLIQINDIDEVLQTNIHDKIEKINNLNHPNILKYDSYFYVKNEGKYFILIEKAESIKIILNQLNDSQKLQYFYQICQTLDFLHNEKKMIHGNLKLKNVLIFKEQLKLANFKIFGINYQEYISAQEKNMIFNEFSQNIDIWSLGILFHKILSDNKHPFRNEKNKLSYISSEQKTKEKRQNFTKNNIFIDSKIRNPNFIKIIQNCLSNENNNFSIKEILGILETEILTSQQKMPVDFSSLKHKYNLETDYKFAKIDILNFESLNNLFAKNLPSELSKKNFLSIEIKCRNLEIRKTECGLTLNNSQKLSLLLNSSLIFEASIAGVIIIINSPWYPFEWDFNQGKGTATAKTLFESIFNHPAFEVFYMKLSCKYRVKDQRCAINLTTEESETFGNMIMSEYTNIKHIYLEFEGLEGALGITEFACLEIVYALLKSNVINLVFKIKGNKNNVFLQRQNKCVELNFNLLKRTKKFKYLLMSFD